MRPRSRRMVHPGVARGSKIAQKRNERQHAWKQRRWPNNVHGTYVGLNGSSRRGQVAPSLYHLEWPNPVKTGHAKATQASVAEDVTRSPGKLH